MKETVKKQTDWLKGLNKLFTQLDDDNFDIIPADERVGYMDNDNVCMIIPKTREFRGLLVNTFELIESRIPFIEYDGLACGTYGPYYLKIMYDLIKAYNIVSITTGKDKPMTLETTDFIMLIAPRVEV